ncbi:hypothetical protein HMPREF0673_01773 [Leyella stercorea DSM 18206]|uniref:Uncharacterized protein n=1 Tax=Leyella stercorea DSM 18206 TaxID=1002367 RepID=G6AYR3_9BACT|nr:hypothetical protein HMPREF0673_01773 [Leyella stercorea DSM 18206]
MPFIFAIRDFKAVFKGVKLQKIFGLTLLRGLKKRVLRDFIPTLHQLATSPLQHQTSPLQHKTSPPQHKTSPSHHNTATTSMLQFR